jgi:hypothetical protein
MAEPGRRGNALTDQLETQGVTMRHHHSREATLLLAALLLPTLSLAQGGKTIPPAGVMPMAAPAPMPMVQPATASFMVPAINGRVTSVRFYEAPFQGTPAAQRVYYSTFQRALTRYVYWQVDLSFPSLPAPVTLPIDAVWYRQDGSVFARQSDDTLSFQAGWSTAFHVRGRGWNDFGNWPVGPYWVDLFVLGDRVANGAFSVADGGAGFAAAPPARPVNTFVPTLNARVTSVKFFEAGGQAPRIADRTYRSYYPVSTTRYIYWEMHLAFPPAYQRQNFAVEAIWYAPDGSVFAHQSGASFYVDQGWTTSDHDWGRGWDQPGQWPQGSYYVELLVNGTRVGYDRFTIGQ